MNMAISPSSDEHFSIMSYIYIYITGVVMPVILFLESPIVAGSLVRDGGTFLSSVPPPGCLVLSVLPPGCLVLLISLC